MKKDLKNSFLNFYKRFVAPTIRFFCHRWGGQDFAHQHMASNFDVLLKLNHDLWLDSSSTGELFLLKTFSPKILFLLKNTVSGGAYRSRVQRALLYTFLLSLMEVVNPLDPKLLKRFILKKEAYILSRLAKIEKLNGRNYDKGLLLEHLEIYKRHSLLQLRVIQRMQQAVSKGKRTPALNLAKEGLKNGIHPKLITEGLSGAYWMRGVDREILGLFKPFDEEILAPNNPLGPTMQGALGQRRARRGVRVGEAAHREVAAFVVDQFFEFGMVPKTEYASFTHSIFFSGSENRTIKKVPKTKIGSFQEYIGGFTPLHKLTIDEGKKIPLEEFQLLVVLDVILGNSDRNSGNFLVGRHKIAAIDHGLCFPDLPEELPVWYWTLLEQGNAHFYPAIKELILNFPIETLSNRLNKRCFIESKALLKMKERIALFAEGLRRDRTPNALASVMTVENLVRIQEGEKPSAIFLQPPSQK